MGDWTELRLGRNHTNVSTQQVDGDGGLLHSIMTTAAGMREDLPERQWAPGVVTPSEMPDLDSLLRAMHGRYSSNPIDKVWAIAFPFQRRKCRDHVAVTLPIYNASTPISVAWGRLISTMASTKVDVTPPTFDFRTYYDAGRGELWKYHREQISKHVNWKILCQTLLKLILKLLLKLLWRHLWRQFWKQLWRQLIFSLAWTKMDVTFLIHDSGSLVSVSWDQLWRQLWNKLWRRRPWNQPWKRLWKLLWKLCFKRFWGQLIKIGKKPPIPGKPPRPGDVVPPWMLLKTIFSGVGQAKMDEIYELDELDVLASATWEQLWEELRKQLWKQLWKPVYDPGLLLSVAWRQLWKQLWNRLWERYWKLFISMDVTPAMVRNYSGVGDPWKQLWKQYIPRVPWCNNT